MTAEQEGKAIQFNPYVGFSLRERFELITRQLKVAEGVKAIITGEVPIPQSVRLTSKGLSLMLFSAYEDLVGLGMKPEEALEATKLPNKEKGQPQP